MCGGHIDWVPAPKHCHCISGLRSGEAHRGVQTECKLKAMELSVCWALLPDLKQVLVQCCGVFKRLQKEKILIHLFEDFILVIFIQCLLVS